MKTRMTSILMALLAGLLISLPVAAETARLLPAAEQDFAPAQTPRQLAGDFIRPEGPRGEPVQAFLEGQQAPADTSLKPPKADSRSYHLSATAEDLSQGVKLPLSASGAVIRLVPMDGQPVIRPEALRFRQGDIVLQGEQAIADLAPADAAGPARDIFGQSTLAFRLAEDIAAGELELSLAETAMRPTARYRIHVFEPESSILGQLSGHSPLVAEGGRLAVEKSLAGEDGAQLSSVTARLRSPSGEVFEVDLAADGGLVLPEPNRQKRGLWELEARMRGEGPSGPIRRDVRLAFEGVVPTARFADSVQVRQAFDEWWLIANVEVATAGRYELRATLPEVGAAHSAAWLEPGQRQLILRFPGRMPVSAELHDLRLVDQTRMGLLHVQGQGIQIEGRSTPTPVDILGGLR